MFSIKIKSKWLWLRISRSPTLLWICFNLSSVLLGIEPNKTHWTVTVNLFWASNDPCLTSLLFCPGWPVCPGPPNNHLWILLDRLLSIIPSTMLEKRCPAPAVGGAVAAFQIRQRGDIFCPGLRVITPTTTKSTSEQRRSSCQDRWLKKKANSLSLHTCLSQSCPLSQGFCLFPTLPLSL